MTAGTNSRLTRLREVLACPVCHGDLQFEPDRALCPACVIDYPIRRGKIYFVSVPPRLDALDDLKGRLKEKLGVWYYRIGVTILGPTYPFNFRAMVRRYLDPGHQIVVDAGCGNHRLDADIVGADLFDYDAVDLVCDLSRLPFKAGSVDAFVTRSVLEHVADPDTIVRAFHDSTKPGGLGLHMIPFLFPYHASPNDYQRYTHEGQARLFRDWRLLDQISVMGPATLMVTCLVEFVATLFSFGRPRLHAILYLAACAVFCPLKFLDVFFARRKAFLSLAPSILSVIEKPESPPAR
jgi:SAM-dependent methyltransferase